MSLPLALALRAVVEPLTMDILMVAAELAPYARYSEAAEAVSGLSKTLRQLGHSVTICALRDPGYEAAGLLVARRLSPLVVDDQEITVFNGQLPSGVELILFEVPGLDNEPLVSSELLTKAAYLRAWALCRGSLEIARQRAKVGGGYNVAHLHDWPAALFPLLCQSVGLDLANIFTVHDVRRQGEFSRQSLRGLPFADNENLLLQNKVNLLKAGLEASDVVTTVSPHYAEELASPGRALALAETIANLDPKLLGVMNGLDYGWANPSTDPVLDSRYDAESSENKGSSKYGLLRQLELELVIERPLLSIVGDLSDPDVAELLVEILPEIIKQDLAVVLAGQVPEGMSTRFAEVSEEFASDYAWVPGPDAAFSRRLAAGSDMVLILEPSAPCDSHPMLAQRYGAIPIAPASAGFFDAIVDVDPQLETGTGFLFDVLEKSAVLGAVARALSAYQLPAWPKLRRRVMRLDLGWDKPTRRYVQIYQDLLGARLMG